MTFETIETIVEYFFSLFHSLSVSVTFHIIAHYIGCNVLLISRFLSSFALFWCCVLTTLMSLMTNFFDQWERNERVHEHCLLLNMSFAVDQCECWKTTQEKKMKRINEIKIEKKISFSFDRFKWRSVCERARRQLYNITIVKHRHCVNIILHFFSYLFAHYVKSSSHFFSIIFR